MDKKNINNSAHNFDNHISTKNLALTEIEKLSGLFQKTAEQIKVQNSALTHVNKMANLFQKSVAEQFKAQNSLLTHVNKMTDLIPKSIVEQTKAQNSLLNHDNRMADLIQRSVAEQFKAQNSLLTHVNKMTDLIPKSIFEQIKSQNPLVAHVNKMANLFPRSIVEQMNAQNSLLTHVNKMADLFPKSLFEQMKTQEYVFVKVWENGSVMHLIDDFANSNKLSALKAIANLDNLKLDQVYELGLEADLNHYDQINLYALNDELNASLANQNNFEKLSTPLKKIISFFFNNIILQIFICLFSSYLWLYINITVKSIENPYELKKFMRACSSSLDKDLLCNLRIISGDNVHLRVSPTVKSDVIMQLDKGTVIQILDKSNRSWLFVEIIDGEDIIKGWVSRRYTLHFK